MLEENKKSNLKSAIRIVGEHLFVILLLISFVLFLG